MLLEAFGWRFLLNNLICPLRFDAFGGFGMEISIENLEISFSLPFDLLYSPCIPYLLFLSSLVVKLSKSFQKSVRTFFIKSLIQKY